jgi:hypothetical protein
MKTKLTHIESKKKSYLPACKQAMSLTQKKNAGKLKRNQSGFFMQRKPPCVGCSLNFSLRLQATTLGSRA